MEEQTPNRGGLSEPLPDFDGRYDDVALIAERGLASAYVAREAQTHRRVFLKILRESKLDDPHAFRLFCQEPALLQRLTREAPQVAVVPVLETGYWRERPFFTQPFLTGWSLDKAMQTRPIFNGRSVLKVMTGCLEYLDVLHSIGVVHGDISPDNIFLETEAPVPKPGCLPEDFSLRLLDFNSARRIDEQKIPRTGRNIIFLKLPYAAPELAQGHPLSVQSDLYALGVVLFEMLVGARPHHEPESIEELLKLKDEVVPQIPAALEVPFLFEEIIRKMLDKDLKRRFKSAAECLGFIQNLDSLRKFESVDHWLSRTDAPHTDKRYFLPPSRQFFITGSYKLADPAPFLSEIEPGKKLTTQEVITERHVNSEQIGFFSISEMDGMKRIWDVPPQGSLKIGRAPDNDIRVDDLRVSRHHAEIRLNSNGHAELINISHGNLVEVNGQLITAETGAILLQDGDQINIIGHFFKVSEQSQGHAAPLNYRDSLVSQEVSLAHDVPVPASEQEIELVDFSVFAPCVVAPGSSFILEVWAYLREQRDKVLQRAGRHGMLIERGSRRPLHVTGRSELTLVLRLDDFEVQDTQDSFIWCGDFTNISFIIRTPHALKPNIYPGQINILHGGLLLTRLIFELTVGKQTEEQANLHLQRKEFKSAFASYASSDRDEVLRRVQGIQATGMDVYLDVLSLRAGQHWEEEVFKHISARDIFYLFWSVAASQSLWVDREWRFALDKRGLDFIHPIPLVSPQDAPPPPELRSKHFNDMILACLKSHTISSRSEQN